MRKLFKEKRGQNVAEYAILIALVVGAIIAMQKFAQRGLQARVRDATEYMVDTTNFPGTGTYNTGQFEPDYSESAFDIDRDSTETRNVSQDNFVVDGTSDTGRRIGGTQNTTYTGAGQVGTGQTF